LGEQDLARTFLAWELTGDIKERLAGIQRDLRTCLPGARFSEASLLHITIRFIGRTEKKKFLTLREALLKFTEEMNALKLKIDRSGFFARNGRAHVFWLGSRQASEEFLIQNRRLHDEAGRCFELPGGRLAEPHITIARHRSGLAIGELDPYIDFDIASMELRLDRIVWYESRHLQGRLDYRKIEEFNLKN